MSFSGVRYGAVSKALSDCNLRSETKQNTISTAIYEAGMPWRRKLGVVHTLLRREGVRVTAGLPPFAWLHLFVSHV